MKTPLGTEVDLGPGHIVLDGDAVLLRERGTAGPNLFSVHVYCGHGRPSELLLSSCCTVHVTVCRRACRGMPCTLKIALPMGRPRPHLIRGSLGQPSSTQTASRSVQPFAGLTTVTD